MKRLPSGKRYASVLENARRVDEMSRAQHQAANLPCAFLVEGRCSAYTLRPSVCASFHSMSRARCEQSFQRPDDIGTPRNSRPVLLELQAFADAVIEATSAALVSAGLDNRKLELHQALRALLEDGSAADRWQAGGALCAAGAEPGVAS
jgi:Fe-S-cluster containining protein